MFIHICPKRCKVLRNKEIEKKWNWWSDDAMTMIRWCDDDDAMVRLCDGDGVMTWWRWFDDYEAIFSIAPSLSRPRTMALSTFLQINCFQEYGVRCEYFLFPKLWFSLLIVVKLSKTSQMIFSVSR